MTQPTSETEAEQLRNIELRIQGVEFFNAFVRKGETRRQALLAIARAAEELADRGR